MSDPASKQAPPANDFFAVVLLADSGRRLKWNGVTQDWDREDGAGGVFLRQKPTHTVGSGDFMITVRREAPSEEAQAVVATLNSRIRERGCEYCHIQSAAAHAIAPNLIGDPGLLCVFRPDPEAVMSFGGNGRAKHWGSPYGCHFVKPAPVSGRTWGVSYGFHLYGDPVSTYDAIDLPWCSLCVDAAHARQYVSVKAESPDQLRAVEDDEHLKRRADLLRMLLDELGDRTRDELVQEMRAGRLGLSVDEYRRKYRQ